MRPATLLFFGWIVDRLPQRVALWLACGLQALGVALVFSFTNYAFLLIATGLMTVASASTVLVLPVRGVQLRIQQAKQEELERVNRAILGETDALQGTALAGRAGSPSLADLIAYRGLVDSVREWPFNAETVRRFGLYLLIPLVSWSGGALVERLIDALLD